MISGRMIKKCLINDSDKYRDELIEIFENQQFMYMTEKMLDVVKDHFTDFISGKLEDSCEDDDLYEDVLDTFSEIINTAAEYPPERGRTKYEFVARRLWDEFMGEFQSS